MWVQALTTTPSRGCSPEGLLQAAPGAAFSHSNLDVLTTWSQTPNAYPAAKLLKPRPNFATFQVIAPGLVDTTAARVEDPKLIAESLLRYVRAWAFGFMGEVFGRGAGRRGGM